MMKMIGCLAMKQLKWWHWILLVLLVVGIGEWIHLGKDPITSMRDGIRDGWQAGAREAAK